MVKSLIYDQRKTSQQNNKKTHKSSTRNYPNFTFCLCAYLAGYNLNIALALDNAIITTFFKSLFYVLNPPM